MKLINSKIIIISLLLLFILSIGFVSATNADLNNNITLSSDNNALSIDEVQNSQLSVSENNQLTAGEKTFTELNNLINSTTGDKIELTDDYKYVDSDDDNGIIISKDNLVINGNGHTIDANEKSKIFTITGHNIVLKNIKIKNGYFDKNYIIHNNVNINENHSAIIWSGHNGTLDNVEITNCIGTLNVQYDPDYTTGSVSLMGAAALYWIGDNGTITNSIFSDNTGRATGSNVGTSGSLRITGVNCIVKNSKFINNYGATQGGGAIRIIASNATIINSQFTNNTARTGGGAIYSDRDNTKIIDSTFINNYGLSGSGGAVVGANYVSIIKSTFTNNNATSNGGAVYIMGINATVTDSIFTDNYANNGGALFINKGYGLVLNSKFSNNSASSQNSMAYLSGGNHMVINSTFTNLYGKTNIAAVRVQGSCINSTFTNFTGMGYALSIEKGLGDAINCTFTDIKVSGYGVLNFNHNHYGKAINCTFINASSSQGTFYHYGIGAEITQSQFINCSSAIFVNGGTISDNGSLIVSDCYFENTRLYSYYGNVKNMIFANCTVDYGKKAGASDLLGFDKIYNSTFIGSTGAAIGIYGDVYNCTFIDNNRGITVRKDNCTISSSVFINNGLNCAILASDTIRNTTIKYNTFINATTNGKNGISCSNAIIESNWFGTNSASAYHPGKSYLVAKLVKAESNYFVGGEWNPIVSIVFCNNGTDDVVTELTPRQVTYTINKTGALQFVWVDSANSGKVFADNNVKQQFNISAKVDNQYLGIVTFDGNNYTLSNTNSFKDLQILINASKIGETLTLNKDYTYNKVFVIDEPNYISINKKIKIIGNVVISGANQVNILNIAANDVEIEGITFTNAKSGVDGGAIILMGNNTKFTNVKFNDNEATGNGGAIYAIGNNIEIKNALFTNDIAQDGSAIYIIGDYTKITNSAFDKNIARKTGGSDIYIKGLKTVLDNITVSESKQNGITITGDNGTVNKITFTNITGDALTINGDNNKITNINMSNVNGNGINSGKNTNINNINVTGGNGTVIIVKENSTISNVNIVNHTGDVIDGNGNNITVSNVNAVNNTGDILKIIGDNAKINNIIGEGGEGNVLYLKGNDAEIDNVDGINRTGEVMDVIGEGIKYKHLSPLLDGVTDPLKIQTYPGTNSPTYTVEGLKDDANGKFYVYVDGKEYDYVEVRHGVPLADITVKNLGIGNYKIALEFVPSGTKYKEIYNNGTVIISAPPVITLTGNNLNVDYTGLATYKVQVLADGKNITDGTNITITFNNVKYTVKTVNGTAALTLNTAIPVGTYTITANYTNKTTANTVIIKNIINANKLKKLKKSKKVNKVKITLLKVDGKIQAGKKLTLKLKNKKVATAKTNKKGTATFKVKKKSLKKFKKGKKVVATVIYGQDAVSKKIKIA